MTAQLQFADGAGLLVSVRSASEALEALSGGAQVIDVKEPNRGPLGAADASTIASVVRAVNGRAPVTAAMGELTELIDANHEPLPSGVCLFKIGLACVRSLPNWRHLWQGVVADIQSAACTSVARPEPTAVIYADWKSAGAPKPDDILSAATQSGCPALLIDTWDKSAGSLFDHWAMEDVGRFVRVVRSQGLLVVLAGSLVNETFISASCLAPDLVGVRTSACDTGRHGRVKAGHVRDLRRILKNTAALREHSCAPKLFS
jgi:(5-formylfuran-3-yl)methyl phosphate synthase